MSINISDPRYQRLVVQLHNLGPRALGEFLLEGSRCAAERAALMARLERYSMVDPALIAAHGGDSFSPQPFYAVDESGTPRPARRIGGR